MVLIDDWSTKQLLAREHLPQQEEPSAAAEGMIPVLTDLVPYHAKSKILEQKPSDSSVSDMSGPRTTDEVLTNERLASSLQTPMPAPDGQIPEAQVPGVQVTEYLSPWYQFLLSRKRPIQRSAPKLCGKQGISLPEKRSLRFF